MTFLFTDIEGSTGLWERDPDGMGRALAVHDQIMEAAISGQGGYVFSTGGDGFAAAFPTPRQAVAAARAAQEALSARSWPSSTPIRVRMGIHTGSAEEREGNYFGPSLNRAARLMAAAHGAQVLVSNATAQLLDRRDLLDLGEHLLKDLAAPERIWQLGTASYPPIRTLDRRRNNLPVQRSDLIGRAAEIGEIAGLLRVHRLVSLLGIGGIGKTRLALAVAAEVADTFDDGVWFVDLVPILDGERLPEAIAAAAGLHVGMGPALDQLSAVLAGRDVLFVLDNCEHLTDAVADLVDSLLETTACRFLITSREPLDLPDEWPVRVRSLVIEHSLQAPAVTLFAQAAARVGAALGEEDVASAVAVCQHLDGLPLALELAGAQLRNLTLPELAGRLDRRFELLERGRRGRRQRQASLLGVLEDTWALLNDDERELLRQLAAFVASFDLDAVEAVANDLGGGHGLRSLTGLIDRSLVVGDHEGGHRLLETVKLFAQRHWNDAGAAGGYEERHTAWALRHIRSYSVEARHTSFELGAWVARHYDDLRAIESRLDQQGRTEDLVELLSGHDLSIGYGPQARAAAMIERVDRYLGQGRCSEAQMGRLHLLGALAGIAARRPDRTAQGSSAAVLMLHATDQVHDLAMAHHAEALWFVASDPSAALARQDEAVALAEATGAPLLASYTLGYRALTLLTATRLDAAGPQLDLLAQRLDGTPYDAAHSAYHQARIAEQFVHEPVEASATCARMCEAQERLGVPYTEAWQSFTALVTANLGDVPSAAAAVASLRDEYRRNGHDGLPDLLLPLAVLAWRLGDLSAARRWLTPIRYAGRQPLSLVFVAVYRQLRALIGLEPDNPVASASLAEIGSRALGWLDHTARRASPGAAPATS